MGTADREVQSISMDLQYCVTFLLAYDENGVGDGII